MSQTAKVLPCGHIFHAPCLGAWLQTSGQQKFTCPICRANLATAADDDGSDATAGGSEAGHDASEAHQAPRMTRAVSQVPEPFCRVNVRVRPDSDAYVKWVGTPNFCQQLAPASGSVMCMKYGAGSVVACNMIRLDSF